MITAIDHHQEPLASGRPGVPRTYYAYRSQKDPNWGWEIVFYFFLGGLASASYLVATLADIFGEREDRVVARTGRYVALGAALLCPLLLIKDLGRPERFTHMMRIVKSRSPMSMGTWGLSGFGLFVGLGALRQAVLDGLIRRRSLPAQLLAWVPFPVSGILGSLSAFFVASYTGALLSFTNVPLWAKNRVLQAPLFLTSALSTGLAAISLVMEATNTLTPRTRRWLGRMEIAAGAGELGLLAGSLRTLGPLARPLLHAPYALPFWFGSVALGTIAPIGLRAAAEARSRKRPSRLPGSLASLLVLAGGLIFRWTVVLAGRSSVKNPANYLAFTREDGRAPWVRGRRGDGR